MATGEPWLQEADKVGKKGRRLMAAQGLGAPGRPGPVGRNWERKEAREERPHFRGPLCPWER